MLYYFDPKYIDNIWMIVNGYIIVKIIKFKVIKNKKKLLFTINKLFTEHNLIELGRRYSENISYFKFSLDKQNKNRECFII